MFGLRIRPTPFADQIRERTISKEATDNFAGKWALVTGASSGLGLEFADLLAAQKVNLVLAARRLKSMEKLASDLRSKYGVDVLVEAINLAGRGAASRLKAVSTRGR